MLLALALFSLAALVFAAGASAATARISITGSVTVGAIDPGTIDIAAASDIGGANPTGTVTVTLPSTPAGAPTNIFHGNISNGGCVRVQGNQAVVVGKLPSSEWHTPPNSSQMIQWAATVIEDNGAVAGSPVDRSRPLTLFATTGTNWCSTTPFGNIAALLVSIDSGDASFGYTDQLTLHPSNPDTDVSVVDPNGLSVGITDATDPDGLNVDVGAGSGFAELSSCGTQVNANAGSTAVFTCGSLIAEVVTGSIDVVLEEGTVISIPEGGIARITEAENGSFTVENLGETDIVVTVQNVETTIDPDDPPLDGWVSSSAQLDKVVTDLAALIANPSTSASTKDKLEDVAEKVDKALAKLEQSPADRQGAAGELEGAVGDLESGARRIPGAADLMNDIAEAAQLLAESAIADAVERGGSVGKIDEANAALAAGNSRLATLRFKDAVARYKDAISKAEGA